MLHLVGLTLIYLSKMHGHSNIKFGETCLEPHSFILHPLFEQRKGENISFRTLGVRVFRYSGNKVGVMSSAKPLRQSCSESLGHKLNSLGDSLHCSSGLIHPHYPKNVVNFYTRGIRKWFGFNPFGAILLALEWILRSYELNIFPSHVYTSMSSPWELVDGFNETFFKDGAVPLMDSRLCHYWSPIPS